MAVVVRGRESRLHGEGPQVMRCPDMEVAVMATIENGLAVYSERGGRRLPREGVYPQLYRPDLYLRAYGRIYRNSGALTPGTTAQTVDAMSLEKKSGALPTIFGGKPTDGRRRGGRIFQRREASVR